MKETSNIDLAAMIASNKTNNDDNNGLVFVGISNHILVNGFLILVVLRGKLGRAGPLGP